MPTKTPEHVIRLIEKAAEEKATFLDLGKCGLTAVPEEIVMLAPHLEGLSLGTTYEFEGKTGRTKNFGPSNSFGTVHNGLQHLTNLPLLKKLAARGCSLSADAIAAIGKLQALESLIIAGNTLSGDFLKDLAKLNTLTELELSNCGIGNTGLQYVGELHALIRLDILNNDIGDIGAQYIAKLTALKYLDIGDNKIGDTGAESIGKLTTLTYLKINDNKIGDTGAVHLSNLKSLTHLSIVGNAVEYIGAKAISKLMHLSYLDISYNRLTGTGAYYIGQLSKLTWLSISGNSIGDTGTEHVCNLKALTNLYIEDNFVTATGAAYLSKLQQLKVLSLSRNSIGNKGAEYLSSLINLTALWVDQNNIGDIGLQHLGKLRYLVYLDAGWNNIKTSSILKSLPYLRNIALTNNPLTDIPDSVNLNDIKEIKAWWKETEDPAKTQPNYWVKMQVTGNGNVGKSSIIHALKTRRAYLTQTSTHGISLDTIDYKDASNDSDIHLQVWDFGGQEIYHGTHRMFIADDSIQLIVYDAGTEAAAENGQAQSDRVNDREQVFGQPVNYWLNNLNNLNNARVIIAKNKIDLHTGLNEKNSEGTKKRGYDFVEVSAYTGEGIEQLHHIVLDNIKQLRSFGMSMPKAWVEVRQWFIDNLNNKPTETIKKMNMATYEELCSKSGVSKESVPILLNFLHSIGLLYYNHELLGNTLLTDLRWALDAIYKPMERSGSFYEQLVDQRGKVRARDVFAAFEEEYAAGEKWLFLSFMHSCGICFPHKDERYSRNNRDLDNIYVFPRFLSSGPTEVITTAWHNERGNESVFGQRLHHFSYAQAQELIVHTASKTETRYIWRNGLLFKEDTGALWLEFKQPDALELRLKGSIRNSELLHALYDQLKETLFRNETSYEEFSRAFTSSYLGSAVLHNEKMAEEENTSKVKLDAIPDKPQQKIPVIVASFAKENEWAVQDLSKQLKTLKEQLLFTWDRYLPKKNAVESELIELFENADGYILFASPDYADPDIKKFIHQKEIPVMLANQKKGAQCFGIMVYRTKLQKYITDNFYFYNKMEVLPKDEDGKADYFFRFITEVIEDDFLKKLN